MFQSNSTVKCYTAEVQQYSEKLQRNVTTTQGGAGGRPPALFSPFVCKEFYRCHLFPPSFATNWVQKSLRFFELNPP